MYIIIKSENAIHNNVRVGCLLHPDGEGLGKRGGLHGAAEAGALMGDVASEWLGAHDGGMARVGARASPEPEAEPAGRHWVRSLAHRKPRILSVDSQGICHFEVVNNLDWLGSDSDSTDSD